MLEFVYVYISSYLLTEEESLSLNPLLKIAQGEEGEKARGCLRSDFRYMKTKLHLPAYTLSKREAASVNHEKGIVLENIVPSC